MDQAGKSVCLLMGTQNPTPEQFTHADMNRDGQLNATDILLLQKQLLQAWLGLPTAVATISPERSQIPTITKDMPLIAEWLMELIPTAGAVPANSGVLYYVHNDPLETPQVLTDESGATVWTASYDPFGKATVNEDPDGDGNTVTLNVRFPGQYFDPETGLHYNYFRCYDSGTGRYLTSDPIGIDGGINTYEYALNNPVRIYVPYGLGPNQGCVAACTAGGSLLGGGLGYLGGGLLGGAAGTLALPGGGTIGGGISGAQLGGAAGCNCRGSSR